MSVKGAGFTFKTMNFPVGEKHVIINDIENLPSKIIIEMEFEKNEDIIELLMVSNAIKNLGAKVDQLVIPYVPFSRQDRINIPGECFSLKVFCDLINSIEAKEVKIIDPHSDVTPALINNCEVYPQHEVFASLLRRKEKFYLVSPDGGALKKIYKLASITNHSGIIECSKKRDVSTGEITGVRLNFDEIVSNYDCFIVDDICDGGRTFIEIAKELKKRLTQGQINLCVTHGFFTKGLEVFDGLIDHIYTRKGFIK